MIPVETLKCTIPSRDAIKDAVIYCVTNPTNATEASTSIATWATAIITLGLLIGAYLAWRSSIRQLEIAKKAEETAFKGIQAQILASEVATNRAIQNAQNLAQDEQRLSAVTNYLAAFYKMRATAEATQQEVEDALQGLISAGIIWRLNYQLDNESKTFSILDACFALLVMKTTHVPTFLTQTYIDDSKRRRKIIEDIYDGVTAELPRFYRKEITETELHVLFGLLLQKLLDEAPEIKEMIPR